MRNRHVEDSPCPFFGHHRHVLDISVRHDVDLTFQVSQNRCAERHAFDDA